MVGDIGIHILDFATFAAASDIASLTSRVKTFHKAEGDRIGDYKLDANDSFVMSVELANGALGVIHATRFATGNANEIRLRCYGDKGGAHGPYRRQEIVAGDVRRGRRRKPEMA